MVFDITVVHALAALICASPFLLVGAGYVLYRMHRRDKFADLAEAKEAIKYIAQAIERERLEYAKARLVDMSWSVILLIEQLKPGYLSVGNGGGIDLRICYRNREFRENRIHFVERTAECTRLAVSGNPIAIQQVLQARARSMELLLSWEETLLDCMISSSKEPSDAPDWCQMYLEWQDTRMTAAEVEPTVLEETPEPSNILQFPITTKEGMPTHGTKVAVA